MSRRSSPVSDLVRNCPSGPDLPGGSILSNIMVSFPCFPIHCKLFLSADTDCFLGQCLRIVEPPCDRKPTSITAVLAFSQRCFPTRKSLPNPPSGTSITAVDCSLSVLSLLLIVTIVLETFILMEVPAHWVSDINPSPRPVDARCTRPHRTDWHPPSPSPPQRT